MALFPYNSQQWFNTDCIEYIDDLGWDIDVALKSGKVCRVPGSLRQSFFDATIRKPLMNADPWQDPNVAAVAFSGAQPV